MKCQKGAKEALYGTPSVLFLGVQTTDGAIVGERRAESLLDQLQGKEDIYLENFLRNLSNPLIVATLLFLLGMYIALIVVVISGIFSTRKATLQQAYRMRREKDHKRLVLALLLVNVVALLLDLAGQIALPFGTMLLVIVLTDLLFLPYILGIYVNAFVAGKRIKELEQGDHRQ